MHVSAGEYTCVCVHVIACPYEGVCVCVCECVSVHGTLYLSRTSQVAPQPLGTQAPSLLLLCLPHCPAPLLSKVSASGPSLPLGKGGATSSPLRA